MRQCEAGFVNEDRFMVTSEEQQLCLNHFEFHFLPLSNACSNRNSSEVAGEEIIIISLAKKALTLYSAMP